MMVGEVIPLEEVVMTETFLPFRRLLAVILGDLLTAVVLLTPLKVTTEGELECVVFFIKLFLGMRVPLLRTMVWCLLVLFFRIVVVRGCKLPELTGVIILFLLLSVF